MLLKPCALPKTLASTSLGLANTTPASCRSGMVRKLRTEVSMFNELNEDVVPYKFQPHFRNQLKAVLLESNTPTQVVRESTLAPHDFLNKFGYPRRRIGGASEVAWNLSSTAFYKAGARPLEGGRCSAGRVLLGHRVQARRPRGGWSMVIVRRPD